MDEVTENPEPAEAPKKRAPKKRAKKKAEAFRLDIGLICPECGSLTYTEKETVVCWAAGCPLKGVMFEMPSFILKRKDD
jgi:hypothetical protein